MSRTPAASPFTPGYGVVPTIFAGREHEFSDFAAAVLPRTGAGIYEAARLVTGERGMGKTALLREMARRATTDNHWTAQVSATRAEPVIPRLAADIVRTIRSADIGRRIVRVANAALERVSRVKAAGVEVELSRFAEPAVTDQLTEALVEAALLARRNGSVLVLFIDEAQNTTKGEAGSLFTALQAAQTYELVEDRNGATLRTHLPIAVYVAGLPGLLAHLRGAGSTFAERSRHLRLEALTESAVKEALVRSAALENIVFDADALDLAVETVAGYPYFLHVVGEHVWNAGSSDVITLSQARRGTDAARSTIIQLYDERLVALTDRQLTYLRVAATLDRADRTSANIAKALDGASRQWGSTQQQLIDTHGLLRRDQGRLAFTLPGLDHHLARRG